MASFYEIFASNQMKFIDDAKSFREDVHINYTAKLQYLRQREMNYDEELKRQLQIKRESIKHMDRLDIAMMKEIENEIYKNEHMKEEKQYQALMERHSYIIHSHDVIEHHVMDNCLRDMEAVNSKGRYHDAIRSLRAFYDDYRLLEHDVDKLEMMTRTKKTSSLSYSDDVIDMMMKLKAHHLRSRLPTHKQSSLSQLISLIEEKIISSSSSSSQHVAAQNTKPFIASSSSSSSSSLSYENDAMKLIQRIYDEEQAIINIKLDPILQHQLSSIHHQLNIITAAIKPLSSSSSSSSSMIGYDHIDILFDVARDVHRYVSDVFNQDSTTHVKRGIHDLFHHILSTIKSSSSKPSLSSSYDPIIMMMSYLTSSIFRMLSSSQCQQLSWRLQALIHRDCHLSIPMLPSSSSSSPSSSSSSPSSSSSSPSSSSMMSYQMMLMSIDSPIMGVDDAWRWLLHSCQLYHHLQEQRLSSSSSSSSSYDDHINIMADSILSCLHHAGIIIYRRYHHHLIKILKHLHHIITSSYDHHHKHDHHHKSLLDIINIIIDDDHKTYHHHHMIWRRSHMMISYDGHHHVDDHTFHAILCYRLDMVIQVGASLDMMKIKPDDVKAKLAHYRINRLQGMFNRLNTEPIKHEQFADEALGIFAMVFDGEGETSSIMQYLLYKLVNLVITNSQEETVLVKKKNTTFKLSRVSSLLCQRNPSLSQWFIHQFHRYCPLTIPWLLEDDDSSAHNNKLMMTRSSHMMLLAMDYKIHAVDDHHNHHMNDDDKHDGDKKASYVVEKKENWMERMIKTFVIYAQIIIQDEQTPFNIQDGWRWLARFMNLMPRLKHKSSIAGEVVDVFLRITSEKMYQVYGEAFMKLLLCLQKDVLPLLSTSANGTQRLAAFLQEAIQSRGKSFPAIYEDS